MAAAAHLAHCFIAICGPVQGCDIRAFDGLFQLGLVLFVKCFLTAPADGAAPSLVQTMQPALVHAGKEVHRPFKLLQGPHGHDTPMSPSLDDSQHS